MNERRRMIYFLLSIVLLSCFAKRQSNNTEGACLFKLRVYDSTTNSNINPMGLKDVKYWFRDSLIIAEGHGIKYDGQNDKLLSMNVYMDRYTFMDLRSSRYAVYKTFSDTAEIKMLGSLTSPNRPSDIWDLSKDQSSFDPSITVSLPDTVIGGIKYKRLRATGSRKFPVDNTSAGRDSVEFDFTRIGYARYDYKSFLACLDRTTSRRIGVPIVRIDFIVPERGITSVSEFELLTNILTKEEYKVFDAWEKKVNKNPAK